MWSSPERLLEFLNARLDADAEWAEDVLAERTEIDLHGFARRMLREVEAKREIVVEYRRMAPGYAYPEGLIVALGYLAQVYSDHPDYLK